MRLDEKLKVIYETIAPTITRSEEAWKAYLRFGSTVYKHPFDNALLVYAQNPKATMLADFDTWKKPQIGRSINKNEKGIAVCEYANAKLTIKHLFDVSQTSGKKLPDVWKLDDELRTSLLTRLTSNRGIKADSLADCISQIVSGHIADSVDAYLQDFANDVQDHFLGTIPQDGLTAELVETIYNSCVYYISNRCGIETPDVTMPTISHFDTIPLVARLGYTVTAISKSILLEIERNVKILESERSAKNERRTYEEQGASRPYQQLGGRGRAGSAPRQVRQNGNATSERTESPKVFTFEDARRAYEPDVPGGRRSGGASGENHAESPVGRPDAADRGHHGADTSSEQAEGYSGGNRNPRDGADTEITEPEREPQGSFSLPDVWYTPINKIPYRVGDTVNSLSMSARVTNITDTNVFYLFPAENDESRVYTTTRAGFEKHLDDGAYYNATLEEAEKQTGANSPNEEETTSAEPSAPDYSNLIGVDKFYTSEASDRLEWVYFNPDSNAGGQFVSNYITYEDIAEAAKKHDNAEDFFDELGAVARQYLTDVDTEDFPGERERFESGEGETHLLDDSTMNWLKGMVARSFPAQQPAEPSDDGSLFMPAADDETIIKEDLLSGSMTQGGKTRIYNFIKTNPKTAELAGFLKDEYGWGGHTGRGRGSKSVDYRPNGIQFTFRDDTAESGEREVKLSWSDVAKRITALVNSGEYLPEQSATEPKGTPLWQEYTALTKSYPNSFVFRRLGDFYEVMGEDANTVADELGFTLTSRDMGLAEKVPVLGIPVHTLDTVIKELVKRDCQVVLADSDGAIEQNIEPEQVYDENEIDDYAIPDEPESYGSFARNEAEQLSIFNSGEQLQLSDISGQQESSDSNIRLYNEMLNAHNGQKDLQIQAFIGDNRVGSLYYSVYEGVPKISFIEVYEDYRRQGIGTAMVQYLAGQYPDTEIEWGMLTEDGAAFKEAVTYTVENEEYSQVMTRLAEVAEQLERYESIYSAGVIIPDDVGEDWNALHDEQYTLQQQLPYLFPVKTFIKPHSHDTAPESLDSVTDGSGGLIELPAEAPREKTPPRSAAPKKINYRYSEADNLFTGGAKTKFRNNIEAIRLVKNLETEGRLATPDEQKMLANYVGWGGLSNAFSKTAAGWENEYQELKLMLDDDEYKAAMNSTITAFYTEPKIAEYMYKALGSFGFQGGKNRKILEPSMGTGNFFSVLPESLQDTKLYGVELDSITGKIARKLYPTADIQIQGFETTRFEDDSVDVIVGNIPFNSIKVYDKRYEDENFLIHDYFIAKSLDLLKPGGIAAVITSKGTMDKNDISAREYFAQRAELIGAIRLPNNAFKALSGTEVTADILFFQKLEKPRTFDRMDAPEWVYSSQMSAPHYFRMNQYFIDNPDMVLGEMTRDHRMYGNQDGTACVAPKDQDLYAELEKAIGKLSAVFSAQPDVHELRVKNEELRIDDERIEADEGTKNYTYVIKDGDIYFCEGGYLSKQVFKGIKRERVKGLCEIRSALLDVIGVQSREWGYQPDELEAAQKKLNEVYDYFVEDFGYINDKANYAVWGNDDQYPLLRSIEDLNDDKTTYSKAPIFTKATIKSYRQPTHAENAKEALEISLNVKLKVDLAYMAYLCEKTEDEIIDELGGRIYLNPQNYYGNPHQGWETAEEYLSGDVVTKLEYAKLKAMDNELFSRNVTALEEVQPPKLLPSDIDFRIGSPWIPIEFYRQFMYETFETPEYLKPTDYNTNGRIELEYLEYTDSWRISSKTADSQSVKAYQEFGTNRANAYEIYEDCLNMQSVTIRDPVKYRDQSGKEQTKYVINAEQTMIARSKQQQIKEAFASWLFKDKDRAEVLLSLYNERFNRIRPREYDGSHLRFDGMSEERELRQHQKNVIARIVYHGTCLMAHEVGAGKTAAMIAAGMYMKNMGVIKKPIYVVPNHLTEQWSNEFMRFFPSANILVTTKADFEKKNRQKFVSKIAMGEYDAIIIGHSQFEKIPISRERQERLLNEEISALTRIIEQMKAEKGENWAIKQMVIFQNNLKDRLERLVKEERKDDLLNFEQLGVDYMFVDEAHAYKNCYTYTKMRNVAGIGQSKSQRASDMLMKCQYLQETNKGRGVTFATGTPISNSMSEMYVMQRFLQPDVLKKTGLHYFDKWAATFGDTISSLEINPEGSGYRIKNRFSKFHNLPELMKMFRTIADIQTGDMLNLPVPEIDGGKAKVIVTERSEFQKKIMESFVERAEAIRSRSVDPEEDNMLKLTNEAKLMAIDPRLVYDDAPNDHDSKLNTAIRNVYDVWSDTADERLTQVIFCDSGTPKPGQFNVYDEVKEQLIEMGVPAHEIAFVHDAKNDAQREAMFEKTRKGEIRVLLGSTGKLGTGTNIQTRLCALHHLDVPWRPSDIIQRDGRGLRFGNENSSIKIFRYVTKDTFDAYLWQIQEQKLRYITQIMTSKSVSRSCEDTDETVLTAAEIKAIATSNPLLAEKMSVDNEVTRLKLLKGNWTNERIVLERNISKNYPEAIARSEKRIEDITRDIAVLDKHKGGDFIITIDGKVYDERTAAGEALMTVIKARCEVGEGQYPVGSYRGLDLYAERKTLFETDIRLMGGARYSTPASDSAMGNITRIENLAERVPGFLTETETKLADTKHQLETARQTVKKPFEYEEKLSELLSRQSEINTKLEFKELSKQQDEFLGERGDNDEADELESEEEYENDGVAV